MMHNLPRKIVAKIIALCSTGSVRWEVLRNRRYRSTEVCLWSESMNASHEIQRKSGQELAGLWNYVSLFKGTAGRSLIISEKKLLIWIWLLLSNTAELH